MNLNVEQMRTREQHNTHAEIPDDSESSRDKKKLCKKPKQKM